MACYQIFIKYVGIWARRGVVVEKVLVMVAEFFKYNACTYARLNGLFSYNKKIYSTSHGMPPVCIFFLYCYDYSE